jgi:hypothetical protein
LFSQIFLASIFLGGYFYFLALLFFWLEKPQKLIHTYFNEVIKHIISLFCDSADTVEWIFNLIFIPYQMIPLIIIIIYLILNILWTCVFGYIWTEDENLIKIKGWKDLSERVNTK